MDFRHQIVTCLFSMLRLSFETQKIKENYAILSFKGCGCYDLSVYGSDRFSPDGRGTKSLYIPCSLIILKKVRENSGPPVI